MNKDYTKAFNKLILNEGGYVNNPDDAGGETYMGICRKNYPNDDIWDIIDPVVKELKTPSLITKALKKDTELTNKIKAIYKRDYWDKLNLDNLIGYKLCYQIFDSAVNIGVGATKKLLLKIIK